MFFHRTPRECTRLLVRRRRDLFSTQSSSIRPVPSSSSSSGVNDYVEETTATTTATSTAAGPTTVPPSVSLHFRRGGSVAVLSIDNPGRRNALTFAMMEQLDAHVRQLAEWSSGGYRRGGADGGARGDDARAVILTGSRGTFCSGLDLREYEYEYDDDDDGGSRPADSVDGGARMLHLMTSTTNRLLSLPVPVVAAIDGHAIGGGAELTTCADIVIMSRDAIVRFVHADRGASTGWGGIRRLVNKVGRSRALRMLLLSECVRGEEEAERIAASGGGGMDMTSYYADGVAERGESALDATMRLIVDPIMELPCSKSIRAIKSAVSAADGDRDVIDPVDGRLNLDNKAVRGEMDSFESVWGGKANAEQIRKARDRLKGKKI